MNEVASDFKRGSSDFGVDFALLVSDYISVSTTSLMKEYLQHYNFLHRDVYCHKLPEWSRYKKSSLPTHTYAQLPVWYTHVQLN